MQNKKMSREAGSRHAGKNVFKKILTTTLIVTVALGAAVGGWFLYRSFESRAGAHGVEMTLDPATKTVKTGEIINAKVKVDTDGKDVSGARFKLNYDASVFQASIDKSNSDFSLFLKEDVSNGVVDVEAGANPYVNSSDALFVTVKFKALKETSPSVDNITFKDGRENTEVFEYLGAGQKRDALNYSKGAKYIVSDSGTAEKTAKLSLSPASAKHNVGDKFNVKMIIDTAGEDVSGARARLSYNKDNFDVSLSTTGSAFSLFPVEENKNGVINLEAGASAPVNSANALLATLEIKGLKKTTPTTDNFTFDADYSKIFKYVVGAPENILASVGNGRYEITITGTADTEAPAAPINLEGEAGNTVIRWTWDNNSEEDLAGYKLYVGTESGKYSDPIDVGKDTNYISSGLTNGQTYYAVVKAYDTSGNISKPSNEASATPNGELELSDPSTGGIFSMPSSLIATGIVFGVIILIALGVTLVVWLIARKKKARK